MYCPMYLPAVLGVGRIFASTFTGMYSWQVVTLYPIPLAMYFAIDINSYDCLSKNKAKIENARFFCANDSTYLRTDEFEPTRHLLIDILEKILPDKSVFEI